MQQKTSINDISCSCCRLTGRKRDGDRLDINKVLFLGHNNAAFPPPHTALNWARSRSLGVERSWLNRRATDTDSRWKQVSRK